MKRILAVLTGLCLMAVLCGCTRYVYAGTESSENVAGFFATDFTDTDSKEKPLVEGGKCMHLSNGWQLKYDLATMKKTLKFTVSFGGRIHIDVLTEGGVLNLRIEDKYGSVIFDEKHMRTGHYSVRCFEHGEYTVYVTAKSHQGGVVITD